MPFPFDADATSPSPNRRSCSSVACW